MVIKGQKHTRFYAEKEKLLFSRNLFVSKNKEIRKKEVTQNKKKSMDVFKFGKIRKNPISQKIMMPLMKLFKPPLEFLWKPLLYKIITYKLKKADII